MNAEQKQRAKDVLTNWIADEMAALLQELIDAPEPEPVACNLRMSAYHYNFEETGVPSIDRILSAVACAGKAYHHTECWNDETTPYAGHVGTTPVEWIQNAANDAAKVYAAPPAPSVPVLTVKCEPDYWSGGHYHEGTMPYIDPTAVWKLPIGTELYTSPPANNQSEQHLEMVNPPAPSVPDWLETTRFLTDVTTAAGLLEHGLRDKGLAQRIGDFAYKYRMLAAAPAAPERDQELARDAERWLSQRDLELLVTFGMQADDCDADGHTLSKEQTRRLCELGVLRNVGFGRSEMTAFGGVLFDQYWEQSRSLPLRTHAEYAAIAAEKGGAA
jgi:hypothetical protein